MNVNVIHNTKEIFNEVDKVSPFALYDGEKLVIHQLQTSAKMLYPTDMEVDIIRAVNKLRIMTSSQIQMYLRTLGYKEKDEKIKKKVLPALFEANFLQYSTFMNSNKTECATRFYSIGHRGQGLVSSYGDHVGKLISSIDRCKVDVGLMVKKIAACNQFILYYGVPIDKVQSGLIVRAQGTAAETDYIFRPTALVNGHDTTIIESVRNKDTSDDILNKLNRINKTLFRHGVNIDVCSRPKVYVVCECVDHMKTIMDTLSRRRYKFDVFYTCDTMVYAHPDRCIYSYIKKRSFLDILSA